MPGIQFSLDDQTAGRFEEYASDFDDNLSQVAAGLLRAALRHGLRPEYAAITRGRPSSEASAIVLRQLARKPQMYAALLESFAPNTRNDVAKWFAWLLENKKIQFRADGCAEVAPKLIPTHQEALKVGGAE